MYKKLAMITAVVLLTCVGIYGMLRYPEAIIMFILAFGVTAAARPMVESLTRRKIKRGLAVLITYLYIIGVFILILVVVGGNIIQNFPLMSELLLADFNLLRDKLAEGNAVQKWIVTWLPNVDQLYLILTGNSGAVLAQRVVKFTSSIAGNIGKIFASLILSIYWTLDRVHFERLWLSLFPPVSRERWRSISHDVENDLGAYLRSEAVQTLLAGVLLAVGFAIIGVPFPIILGAFGAVAWLVPWVGAAIALAVVGIVSLWLAPMGALVWAILLMVVVYLFLELVVEPHFFKRRRYNSWMSILLFLALSETYGVLGMLLAPPIATTVEILVRRISKFNIPSNTEADKEDRTMIRMGALRQRLTTLYQKAEGQEELILPQTANLMERLDQLSLKVNFILARKK